MSTLWRDRKAYPGQLLTTLRSIKAILTHLSLWTSAVFIRIPMSETPLEPSPPTKAIPHTLVAFTTQGMVVSRYKTKEAALFFQSFLRLIKIDSKVFPLDVVH